MDTHTLQTLFKRQRKSHIFAPSLGNGPNLRSPRILEANMHPLDWWGKFRVEVAFNFPDRNGPGKGGQPPEYGLLSISSAHQPSISREEFVRQVYIAGDTRYRAIQDGQNEDELPICPAFKKIGETFGGIDLAMIPIGAHSLSIMSHPVR
ncbi:hypothetical protein BDN72DRAFT_903076 [Pluteus cervinus]|uniref:Uncharacterized protein n=1 Tax=Pluteus cervinus TaxID=181527 RepID=A0ACD3A9R5_9AGAR|nr:hypothetical protein BDN72DRAFT_903076 [Pluteus cervinus]